MFCEVLVGEEIELVGLVPLSERVAELLTQVEDTLADEGTAIEEEGGGVEGLVWLVVFLSVGYADVLVGCLYELVSQLFFELGGGSIGVDVL